MKKIVVIGAGPAGLFASIQAARKGAEVVVVEKKDRPARKLMITGKGRCNLTNQADVQELIENIPGNGEFLYSAFYTYTNSQLVDFFNSVGVKTKVERGGRVFPQSDRALDIVDALIKQAKKYGVRIICNTEAEEITVEEKSVRGLKLKGNGYLSCDALVLATGGMSYPATGSTGDGYKMAEKTGHTVITPKPSLVPLDVKESWVRELQGLSLKNVAIRMNHGSRILYEDFGEMLFTHFGVSGPIIISSSRHLLDTFYENSGQKKQDVSIKLSIDLKPALTIEKLDGRIQRDFTAFSRKLFKNSLDQLLPSKLIPVIIKLSGIDQDKPVNQITRAERNSLVKLLKNMEMTITGFRPIEEAIITAGGVKTDQINPSTMESKLIKGLFFAGEIIDVDGYTGGYNLQIAFSTGYLAGVNSAGQESAV